MINAFVEKLRRLIFVTGARRKQTVSYHKAYLLQELQINRFIHAIVDGGIAIDFDAKFRADGRFRNHGTKFRIRPENLPMIYHNVQKFEKPT